MKFHSLVLGKRQDRVLQQIGPWLHRQGYVLGGGTAVALYFGHRRSVDLDFFTSRPMRDPMRWADQLKNYTGARLRIEQVAAGTLHLSISGIRVTFLEYRYRLLRKPIMPSLSHVPLLSPLDLAAMKLSAVAQRGAKRDFLDIYALGTKRFSLPEMLSAYQMKFGVRDVAHVLTGLNYFDDANREGSPRMIWPVHWPRVKETIQSWIHDWAK